MPARTIVSVTGPVSLLSHWPDDRHDLGRDGERALSGGMARSPGQPRRQIRPRERITVEYVLLAGINDTPEDARRLANFCATFPHQINLIPFNEHRASELCSPSESVVDEFARAVLAERRTVLTVRRSRGRDVGAACGQLVLG